MAGPSGGEVNGASAGTMSAVIAGMGGSETSQGGTSGGMAAALPLPAGCEARASAETTDTCSLAVYCDTASHLTTCTRLFSGRWQCRCEPDRPDRIYEVENAPGLEACALAAQLCAPSQLELREETCEATSRSSAEDCRVDLDCGRPFELGVGTDARAWLMRFGSATCERAEPGVLFGCACASGEVIREYDLLVQSGEPDCRPLADFCMSGGTTDFVGEPECLLASAVSSSEGCDRSEACVVPMPLTEEVSLAQVEPRYASCVPLDGGGADCICSSSGSSFRFQTSEAPDAASCESAMLNCADDAVIEGTGAVSCQPAFADTNGADSCYANLDCWQAATVDEREVVAQGQLAVACARGEQGTPWWCSCASNQQTARFELGAADVDAQQACSQAPAGCLEHLSVHLGPYGDFVDPPDPLSPLP